MREKTVILDCYTDEPSGYGVRPYLGTHQTHLSQALAAMNREHVYLTIDDLRFDARRGGSAPGTDSDLDTLNTTRNRDRALELLTRAETVFVVLGCFVDYDYFSCRPPRANELAEYLSQCRGRCIGFYVLSTIDGIAPGFGLSALAGVFDEVEHGNTYRYVLRGDNGRHHDGTTASALRILDDPINPDYELLAAIGRVPPPLLDDLTSPVIAEIETGTGCNVPTCKFCIESERSLRIQYREPEDVVAQIECLYDNGVRHFRLGRQPNFFHYQRHDTSALEKLLYGIREACPEIRMLHIDNVNIVDVVAPTGPEFARLVAQYCTSGNVAPLGIESFDPAVRDATRIAGSVDQVHRAIEIINEHGSERGEAGIPKLLPGVNLIHNLPGSSDATHERNLEGLLKILGDGLMTYRLYYRNLTPSTGVTFVDDWVDRTEDFRSCFDEVNTQYVMPMQSRVYPPGTVITGDWEVIRLGNRSVGRTLGTSSIKVEIDGPLELGTGIPASIRITGNLGYRLLKGQAVRLVGR